MPWPVMQPAPTWAGVGEVTSEVTEGGTTLMTKGTVKWFNADKGYRFLAVEGGGADGQPQRTAI